MKHLINLERLKVHLSNKFKTTLNEIDEFLQLVVFRHEISELKYKEFELLIGESKQKLLGFLVGYALDLSNDWRELYNYSYMLETKMVDDDKLDTLNINKPQFGADSPIKLSAQVGVTLNQILAKFGDEQSTQISNAINYAYSNGLTNQELIQIIRGTRKNRYQDGILQTTTRHAKTIAHTGTAIVASQAKQQFIHDNKDIIKGIKILATLDLRTSGICRHLDGEIMPIDKAVYPPYHYNCRSSFEIVYDGYQSPKQRASMDGVVKNQTYYEWLKNQPAQYQDEVLGKTRAKLFRDGGMTVERFRALQLDKHFTPLTLEQMRALEPKAFEKAFGVIDETKGENKPTPFYQTINLGDLKPRRSEVIRLQNEPIRHGEKPKTPRPAEAELADLLQQYFGIYLVRYDDRYHKISPTANPPDFAKKHSDLPSKQWQTLDVMYAIGNDVDIKAYLHSMTKSDKAWDRQKENIINHIEKSDIVPLDLRKFDKQRLEKIIDFLLSLDEKQQNKILIIQGDNDDYDK